MEQNDCLSRQQTIFKLDKFVADLDLDRPLTDYFINSTHNTYLTGHQLIGKSSSKMYSTSLLYNFRMVELDCYEGEGDEIVITHGYTLVDNVNLDDILVELKEKRLRKSLSEAKCKSRSYSTTCTEF